MIKKYYELEKGDKANHGGEILTFIKIDGMYAMWINDKDEIKIGHSWKYEQKEDGIFYQLPE